MALATLPPVPRLVGIDAGGGRAFVDALQEAWSRGDAVLPTDHRLPEPERARLRRRLGVGDDVEPGDALVVATSGSTGEPKGAVLTHAAVAASAAAVTARIDEMVGEDYGWLACLPLAHVGGLGVVTRALVTDRPLTVLERFDAGGVEAVARATDRPLVVSLVATALGRIDAGLFARIILGGSAPPTVLPPNVSTTYGMTETGGGVVYDSWPLPGVEVRRDGHGELHVRGPMLLRCYRDGTDPKVDGWLPTGDLGEVGPDGAVVVHGRRDDLIITGGENVWPGPVEDAIAAMASVADVAVVGRADEEWGQRVVACVVPADPTHPPSLVDIRAAVKGVLPSWCAPKGIEVVPYIPRSALGKVQRRALEIALP